MSDKLKYMKTIIDKIVFPLVVTAILGLFGMWSRIQAVESKVMTLESAIIEQRTDLSAIRCVLTKDELSCLKYKALSGK